MVFKRCMTVLMLVGPWTLLAQTESTGGMAASVKKMWPAGVVSNVSAPGVWSYEEGVLLDGMTAQWWATADGSDFAYVQAAVDRYVAADGTIRVSANENYPESEHSLDDIEMGRSVLMLYRVTRAPKYYKAAKFLHDQLMSQPRTASGGFWHKGIYPNQVWLDGSYMAEPFLAEYGATFEEPSDFDEVVKQLLLMDSRMRDLSTGLLRHGWDESRSMAWADKATGLSPEAWARANGWYAMALVDVLDWIPQNHPGRGELVEALNKTVAAALAYQDRSTGLWWEVMDRGGQPGNFREASASCMFAYVLAKGVRRGYLAASYLNTAEAAWDGINRTFLKADGAEDVRLTGTVKSAGLGGKPYRPGTYAYYVGEKVVDNDSKGVGAFLLAGSELQQRDTILLGRGRTAGVDAWFNSQTRVNAAGRTELFHYKWNDESNDGFSFLGRAFQRLGMELTEVQGVPNATSLKGVDTYLIVSPDTLAKNPNRHVIDAASADAIQAWVSAGGVLVLMANDSQNTDLDGLNLVSERFGLHFSANDRNKVQGDQFEQGTLAIPAGTAVFQKAHTTFMKDTCTLEVRHGATAVVTDRGDVMMATAASGNGTVFAVVDPWIYNEYTDGRKLPARFDTYPAGMELTQWLLKQMH